jgi:hypothetical protein
MAKVDLRKTVYNKDQFNRVIGGREFTTFTLNGAGTVFSIEEFFAEYENLFLTIPINGPSNSHEYLVRKSGELVGFQRTTEDIQPLLDEIASLREQLLQSRQGNINLQIEASGGGIATNLNNQFNELLNALADQPDISVNILDEEVTEEDLAEQDTDTTIITEVEDNPPELDLNYISEYGIPVLEVPAKAFSPSLENPSIITEFKPTFPHIKDVDNDLIGITEIIGQPFPAPQGTRVDLIDPELIRITASPVGSSFILDSRFDSSFRVRVADSKGNTIETQLGIKFKIE